MGGNQFGILSGEIVVRVQKLDNSSANRFWRGGHEIADSQETREERMHIATELNALSVLAKNITSDTLPALRFAVATVDGVDLFLADLPVHDTDNVGRSTGILVAGPRKLVGVSGTVEAYLTACSALNMKSMDEVRGALEEVFDRRPKVRGRKVLWLLLAGLVVLLGLLAIVQNPPRDPVPPPPGDGGVESPTALTPPTQTGAIRAPEASRHDH